MKNTQKFLIILFSIALLLGCHKGEGKIPEDILPKNKMVAVLVDVHLARAAFDFSVIQGDSITRTAYYDYIYKIHNVSKKNFTKSFSYYTEHFELMEKVYQEVIIELSKKQAEKTNE